MSDALLSRLEKLDEKQLVQKLDELERQRRLLVALLRSRAVRPHVRKAAKRA